MIQYKIIIGASLSKHEARHWLAVRGQRFWLVAVSVVKKRNTTSVIWDYFGLQANPDGSVVRGEANYPVCRSCGTSMPSERIFSKAGCIADHHRARLTPENVDKLVFLASNIQ